MAIRRRLFASTPGYSVSAKQRSYGMPTRTLPTYPRYSRSGHYGDTRSEDTLLFDRVSQVSYLSDALLDEGYDTARRSRGRDQQLLREATNAIVSSESYATPQTSVASRRVARGRVIRAASVPPRSAPPAYSEVDRIKATTAASTTTTKTSGIKFVPSRPIIVYTVRPEYDRRARSVPPQVKRAEARAASVPPSVFYGGRAEEKAQPRVVTTWRSVAERWIRSSSAPPARRRRRALRATPRFIFDEPPPPPLPTANLRAHKVPRRFLSRGPVRTPFSSLYGYYQHDRPLVRVRKPDRTAEEEQRARIRRLVLMSRVLGSSSMRVSPAQPRSRVGARVRSLLAPAAPKPKALPARQSLIGFPQVYVPSKGPKPSNRAKAAIIASKLEPDPIKRRRPRSQFAADKLRNMRKEAQESVYTGTASAGMTASTPPLTGVEQRTSPVSELRRRIRKTLNKSRMSYS